MRNKYLAIIFILSLSVFIAACGGVANTPGTNNANTTAANGNTTNPLDTKKATPETTTNNAPTLTPLYKAYCEARVKKDEAALRKIFSSDTIKYFESEMKAEKIKTLSAYLEDEQISTDLCEVRNEQINGDTAVAEVRIKAYPNGTKFVFVKENGEWKMTDKSPSIDSVKQSAANSNTAK